MDGDGCNICGTVLGQVSRMTLVPQETSVLAIPGYGTDFSFAGASNGGLDFSGGGDGGGCNARACGKPALE
jgi:hypothetical protein